jgi:SPP1 family phage portal protein
MGAFEVVISLLDAINKTESDRENGVEGFVQSLMRFHNVDISSEDYEKLKSEGAIKYKDIEPNMKATVDYITNELKQGETQTLVDDLYESVLTICGMPNRNTGNGDNGIAVVYRDGWSAAETRAKDTEMMFKKSERSMLRILLNIVNTYDNSVSLKVNNIEIRFTRRNYENIWQKAQVLDLMLKNGQIDPKLAFQHCGMFADPDLAYTQSVEYVEKMSEGVDDESDIDGRDNSGTGSDTPQGISSGTEN